MVLVALAFAGCVHRTVILVPTCPIDLRLPPPEGTVELDCLQFVDAQISSGGPWSYLAAPLPQFEYPVSAIAARVRGTVELEGYITQDGSVGDGIVLRGLPMGLNEAALRALCGLRFEGLPAGDSVPTRRLRATFRYELR